MQHPRIAGRPSPRYMTFMAALDLSLSETKLTFGGTPLLNGASLEVAKGARIALVGRNGSGKSTLLKIAAGVIEADDGVRFVHPGVTVRYLPQEPDFSGFDYAEEYISAALDHDGDAHTSAVLMDALQIPTGLKLENCSGGEARRVAIAACLISKPDILLLDEPTNHLDITAITWLEEHLKKLKSAIVLISHDRRFLETLTTSTVWIDRGDTRTLDRGFSHFEAWRDKTLEEEADAHHKLGRKIVAEEHWMRYGVTARRKRNMRRVGELKDLRKQLKETKRPDSSVNFSTSTIRTSGKQVIVAKNIEKSFGTKKVIDDFSVKINRAERIGLVGPNGAGKTTLINLLIGALPPDAGTIEIGTNLDIVSLSQKRDSLKPEMRLADAITDQRGDWVTIGDAKKHVASYLQDFLFAPEQWRAPVQSLSGGERGRLALAAALAKPSNFLVLDEPTNDLDLETLDLLEDMLASYDGTLLLVSHDRSFIDRIVTSVIAPEAGQIGRWRRYAGGYDDMVTQRGCAPGMEASQGQKAKKTAQKQKVKPPQEAKNSKLSYKDKYALENLPGEISGLESQIVTFKKLLADPNLFHTDPKKFNDAATSLEQAEEQLAACEEQWLLLAIKQEALDS